MADLLDEDKPRLLGPYVLLIPLAEGGMGSIHVAAPTQSSSDSPSLCTVKVLKPGLAAGTDYLPRFVDEARIAVLLQHENLCHVFDAGEADGELFLAMELIEGVTFKRLAEVCRKKNAPLTTAESTALAMGLLRGLDGAHHAKNKDGTPLGVVHRDVSPHNVMVDIHGRVKVIDFGLATSVLKETVTEAAVVLGKSAYMAPEQARGEDTGATIDQYAAAIVLYELLVGDRYYGDLPSRAIWSIVGSGAHLPRGWDRVPLPLVPILKKALATHVDARFVDCGAFADALGNAVPEAESTETRQALAARVQALKPRELGRREEALRILRSLPPGIVENAPESTERVRARVTAGVDRIVDRTTLDMAPFGATMIDETSSTKTERIVEPASPPALPAVARAAHHRRNLMAAAGGFVVAVGIAAAAIGIAVGISSREPDPVPVPVPVLAPVVAVAPVAVAPVAVAPVAPVAPVAVAVEPVAVVEPVAPVEVPKKPPKKPLTATAMKSRARKISRCDVEACGSFVNQVVLKIPDDIKASDLATANKRLTECENLCASEP